MATDKQTRFAASITLDADDIVSGISRADIIDFVIAIDHSAHDWEVTLRLCDHFEKLRKDYEREEAEDAAKRAGT